jgi:putative RNA 2'-phosphotransferase
MKTQAKNKVTASKFLSLVLRHQPELIGLELDAQGWACVDTLVTLANASGNAIDRALILEIIKESDKQRFALSGDGLRIRANQGHSIDVALGLQPSQPPDTLYHGTATRFLASILASGLHAGQRQHVHLSNTEKVAIEVGKRHGSPVVLLVDAKAMAESGHLFYLSENGVWLTGSVPANCLKVL